MKFVLVKLHVKNVIRLYILILLLLFSGNNQIFAQRGTYNYALGIHVFKGFIYKHSNKIGHLTKSNPVGFEIYYNKLTNGNKSWEAVNKFPEVGYSIGYYNYRNEVLGSTIATLVHIQYYLTQSRIGHSLKIHLGTGLGFNTHPYNAESNNKNNVLGSVVTFTLQPRLIYTYTTNSHWYFTASPNLTHFSNGSLKQPNKGINIVTFNLGVGKILGSEIKPLIASEADASFDSKLTADFAIFTGIKNNSEGRGNFPFITFQASANKRFGFRGGVNTGVDLFYSFALKEQIKEDQQFTDGEYPDFKRVGWYAGYEWYISRVSLIANFGYYIYRPYKEISPIYQRVGIKFYNKKENIFLVANLKTHGGTAEMAEFGIGFRIK